MHPDDADALLDDAVRRYRDGQWAAAAGACRAILARVPGHVDTLNLLGMALHQDGDSAAAAAVLEQAVRGQIDRADLLTNLIVVLHARQDWAAARHWARLFAVADPGSAFAWSRLALSLQQLGNLESAAHGHARAARIEPAAIMFCNLAQCERAAGRRGRALDAARLVMMLDPGDAAGYGLAGFILLTLGRPDDAAAVFRRALVLDPAGSRADAAVGLARCGRYQAARAAAGNGGGLVMRGEFRTYSGYGHFTERFLRTLRSRDVPVHAIGLKGHKGWEHERLDRPVSARVALQCVVPQAIEPIPGLATVAFTMIEATRISPAWRRASDAADLIVVPTRSSYTAWAEAGFPEDRLRLCPLGADPLPAAGSTLVLADGSGRLVSAYRHRFLNMSDTLARKNLDGILRVWLRATQAGDDAVLILKLGKAPHDGVRPWLAAKVAAAEQATGRRLGSAAPVTVIDSSLTDAEIDALFRTATHYWSLSHGEGWDLPMTKAGSLGLSLIAPRHSAYLDYLDDSVARLVPARIGPARPPGSQDDWPLLHGLDWWVPDEDAAAEILVDIIRHGAVVPSARDHLLRHFTWDQATDRLQAILAQAAR